MSGSRLKCPRDGTVLDAGTFHGQLLFKCSTCNGAFVEQRFLLPLLKALGKDIRHAVPLDYPIDTISDKGGGLLCPRCAATMEHYGYMGDRHIMIDSCSACRHMWVDAEELGGMSLLYARGERFGADRRARDQSRAGDFYSLFDSHVLRVALEIGLLAGCVQTAFMLYFVLLSRDKDL